MPDPLEAAGLDDAYRARVASLFSNFVDGLALAKDGDDRAKAGRSFEDGMNHLRIARSFALKTIH